VLIQYVCSIRATLIDMNKLIATEIVGLVKVSNMSVKAYSTIMSSVLIGIL
jgi:hypothetical protein